MVDKTRNKNGYNLRVLKNRYTKKNNFNFMINYLDDKITFSDYKENVKVLTEEAEDIIKYLQESNTTMFKASELIKPLGLKKNAVWIALKV